MGDFCKELTGMAQEAYAALSPENDKDYENYERGVPLSLFRKPIVSSLELRN